MKRKGYVRGSVVGLLMLWGIVWRPCLGADEAWEEAKRKEARTKAAEAVRAWAASEPLPFRLPDDAYTAERPPKHGGPLHQFYAEQYGRPGVLQLHPYEMDVPSAIEAKILVPANAKELTFVVSSHENPAADVGWDVQIDGKTVLSETLKTGGRWKAVGVPVQEYAGREATLRIAARAEGWSHEFLFLDHVGVAGNRLSAQADPIRLVVQQFDSSLARVHVGKTYIGALECVVAQFEREGLGYKKSGAGCAEATHAKEIKVVEGGYERCIVDVTMSRDSSKEAMRRFEATFRLTLYAGQNWFESRLVSIKNTDAAPYEVRGYGYLLRPGDIGAAPVGYPGCAGSILNALFFGAFEQAPGDFSFAACRREAGGCGDITRKLSATLKPGDVWDGAAEPPVVLFVGEGAVGEAMFRETHRLRPAVKEPKPYGRIVY
ncbi:MAG: hypothetical protein AB1696_28575 [Planctomycetota bacterium]